MGRGQHVLRSRQVRLLVRRRWRHPRAGSEDVRLHWKRLLADRPDRHSATGSGIQPDRRALLLPGTVQDRRQERRLAHADQERHQLLSGRLRGGDAGLRHNRPRWWPAQAQLSGRRRPPGLHRRIVGARQRPDQGSQERAGEVIRPRQRDRHARRGHPASRAGGGLVRRRISRHLGRQRPVPVRLPLWHGHADKAAVGGHGGVEQGRRGVPERIHQQAGRQPRVQASRPIVRPRHALHREENRQPRRRQTAPRLQGYPRSGRLRRVVVPCEREG